MYITFSVDKYEMLKGSKSLQVSAELSYGSPTISNKSRYLLHVPHWVTKPAQTHQNPSNGCTATVTPTVTGYK